MQVGDPARPRIALEPLAELAAPARGEVGVAPGRGEQAGQDLEQGGLAHPVRAAQPDGVAGRDGELLNLEQVALAKAHHQLVGGQGHGVLRWMDGGGMVSSSDSCDHGTRSATG